jgi:Sulfotransferase domain
MRRNLATNSMAIIRAMTTEPLRAPVRLSGNGVHSTMTYRRLMEWLEHSECRPIVVASYPRSGTHLLIDCLRLNFAVCSSWKLPLERIDQLYLNLANMAWRKEKLSDRAAIRILSRVQRPLIKTHAWPDFSADVSDSEDSRPLSYEFAKWLNSHASFLYVYRDGRETLASRHWMSQQGLPSSARVSLGEFLRQSPHGVSRPRMWAEHVRGWMKRSGIHGVSMDRLLSDPTAVFGAIGKQLGMPLVHRAVRLPTLHDRNPASRLLRWLACRPHSTAIRAPRRPLPWRSALSFADREFFLDEVGDLLIRLGYETSDDWVNPANDARTRRQTPPSFRLSPMIG